MAFGCFFRTGPYRCFYSRNIANVFMAGRNISVTQGTLGATAVMRTCGTMGEIVGKDPAEPLSHIDTSRTAPLWMSTTRKRDSCRADALVDVPRD